MGAVTRYAAACALIAHLDTMRLLADTGRVANGADQQATAILTRRYDELTAVERDVLAAIPRQMSRAGVLAV